MTKRASLFLGSLCCVADAGACGSVESPSNMMTLCHTLGSVSTGNDYFIINRKNTRHVRRNHTTYAGCRHYAASYNPSRMRGYVPCRHVRHAETPAFAKNPLGRVKRLKPRFPRKTMFDVERTDRHVRSFHDLRHSNGRRNMMGDCKGLVFQKENVEKDERL